MDGRIAGHLSFIAIYRPSDLVENDFAGQLSITILAEDFRDAAEQAQAQESRLELINFTLASLEYQP